MNKKVYRTPKSKLIELDSSEKILQGSTDGPAQAMRRGCNSTQTFSVDEEEGEW